MPEMPRLLTVPQVAEILQVSEKSVYEMAAREQLPGRVPGLGRRVRFREADIREFLLAPARPPSS